MWTIAAAGLISNKAQVSLMVAPNDQSRLVPFQWTLDPFVSCSTDNGTMFDRPPAIAILAAEWHSRAS